MQEVIKDSLRFPTDLAKNNLIVKSHMIGIESALRSFTWLAKLFVISKKNEVKDSRSYLLEPLHSML